MCFGLFKKVISSNEIRSNINELANYHQYCHDTTKHSHLMGTFSNCFESISNSEQQPKTDIQQKHERMFSFVICLNERGWISFFSHTTKAYYTPHALVNTVISRGTPVSECLAEMQR